MTLSKQPVSSFGAELQSVLRKGANKSFDLVFDTPNLAIRFRHRINALRAAMKREKHPDAEQLYRCGVYVDKANPCRLIIGPRDSEFQSALARAGLDIANPTPSETVEVSSSPADDFLTSLVEETRIPPLEKSGDE